METENSSNLTNDPLAAISRRIEMQQANLQLEIQFQKNLEFFKTYDSNIFKRFKNYSPSDLRLMYTEEGYVNLVNHNLNDRPVYPSNPKTFCQDYVDSYAKEPTSYRIDARTTKALDEENDAHINNMNKLIRNILAHEETVVGQKLKDNTNFMLMMGLGLGFQITQLMEKTNISHLCIIEPHEDIFFASMHTLDWQLLHEHFKQKNHSMAYIIGQTPVKGFGTIQTYLRRIGIFNAVKPFLFDHLSSVEMKASAGEFFDKLPSLLTAIGYFDDEQISLSHTIKNYRNETPLLRNHALLHKKHQNRPAFVIGNGPSLDNAKELLEKYGDQAIIFSCGTALGALNKLGIRPDFHVEMERTRPVYEWIDTSTDEEYRKDIVLLALNTVHPDAIALFDHNGIGMKSNDLGTHFLCQFIGKEEFIVNLQLANPTVTNTGLAFATALGFKEIYLVGTDLGFPAGDKHHSTLSSHYDVKDEHVEDLDLYKHDAAGNTRVEGNFGGEVITTPVYNHSRFAMESLLRLNKDVNCYNTSHGVMIPGATPISCEDIQLVEKDFSKTELTQSIFKDNFHNSGLKKMSDKKSIIRSFKPALSICDNIINLFSAQPKTITEATALLNEHHNLAIKIGMDNSTQYIYSLFKGSFAGFGLALAKCLYARAKEEDAVALFNENKIHYINFLQQAKTKVSNELLTLDSRERQLKEKFK